MLTIHLTRRTAGGISLVLYREPARATQLASAEAEARAFLVQARGNFTGPVRPDGYRIIDDIGRVLITAHVAEQDEPSAAGTGQK